MILPATQDFSTIPQGGVFSDNASNYFIKTDSTSAANLATGGISTTIAPTAQFLFFPTARLVLG